jgi:hypothetical protein
VVGVELVTATLDAIELVAARRLVTDMPVVRFGLAPGDHALVSTGQTVEPGQPLLEHVRDARLEDVLPRPAGLPVSPADATTNGTPPDAGGQEPAPTTWPTAVAKTGDRWTGELEVRGLRRRAARTDGELLAPLPSGDKWWLVTGEHRDTMVSPIAGEVVDVAPGAGISVRVRGRAMTGVLMTGQPAHGRLDLATDAAGELRTGGIDVGRAGTILVVGARIDAEALTRARAMGVRGIVVASLAGKDLRDLLASERRQRAALHGAPPFGILVLEGAMRRALPSPVVSLFEALAGSDVGIVGDPPAVVWDVPDLVLPTLPPDLVRVKHGPHTGREGRLEGLAGLRRFEAGTQLESGWVRFDETAPVALPLADLERFV